MPDDLIEFNSPEWDDFYINRGLGVSLTKYAVPCITYTWNDNRNGAYRVATVPNDSSFFTSNPS